MPYIPYLPNIPYFPNMPYQTDHTHHTYPTYHTTPPPHHRGGRGTAPHRHHTTGGEGEDLIWGQYMGPIPWGVGGGGGWQGLVHIYCIQIYQSIHIYPIRQDALARANSCRCPSGCQWSHQLCVTLKDPSAV